MGILSALLGDTNPVAQWANQNSNWLGAVGSGLGNGLDTSQLGQGKQMDYLAKQKRDADALAASQVNSTKNWLMQHHPDLAQMVDAGMPVSEAWQTALQRDQPQAPEPWSNPYMSAGDGKFFNTRTGEYTSDPNAPPPAADQKQIILNQQKDVATGTILDAANTARKLGTGWNVGMGGASIGMNPESDAAELRRQVEVLKSKAKIENLSAMRQASPTGGALGAVSDSENAMLAAAAGALDPNASEQQFKKALDNYELTLLQIVHGPVAGKQIFDQTRNGEAYVPMSASPVGGNGTTSAGVPWGIE